MSDRITIEELKSYLWNSAVLLRTHIDAGAYKQHIFPLLFFKRLCDVYDEEEQLARAKYGEDFDLYEDDIHTFVIPEGHHWRDVRNVPENVGKAIVDAFRAIELANSEKLQGVFGDASWTNKAKLPDHLLKDMIEHFSSRTLSLANCPEDELGQGYEYLIKQFADDSGHTAQEFYTNRTVVHLMTEMLQPQSGESVYDPTCGSAGMLISCIAHLKNKGEEWRNLHLYGQEINQLTSAIGRMNLFLHGVQDFDIVNDDTLRSPAFLEKGQLKQFDLCLANPPYSISQWDRVAFEHDKYGRNMYGTPPQARADYAFIQHIIASLNDDTGRAAILLPHGVLNRTEEKEIRKAIVESDCIDAVIGLGRHLFYNSGLESCVLVLRKNKPASHRNTVLFIEAEKCTHKVQSQSFLFDEDIQKIVEAYYADYNMLDFSCRVTKEQIMANEGNLNIKLYVNSDAKTDDGDFADNLDAYLLSSTESATEYSELGDSKAVFDAASVLFKGFDRSEWRRVKLSDVAEEYSVRVDEPSESEYEWYIGSDCIDGFGFRIARRESTEKVHSAQKLFKAGDYLLVRRSLYGSDFRERAPRADFDGVCSADILTIREKPEYIADGYLIAVLYSKRLWEFIVSNSTGSLTRRIKWNQLKDFEFDLPDIPTQRRLADLLWAMEDAKTAYKNLIAATDDLVKSQFVEMFGENKKGCSYLRLDECCSKISGGKTPSMSHPEFYGGDIPFIKSGDVKDSTISQGALWLTKEAITKGGAALLPENTVIVVIRSAALRHEFHVAVSETPVVINQDLKAFQPKTEFLPIYLQWSILSHESSLLSKVQTVLTSHIEMSDLLAVPVMVASIEQQKAFSDFKQQADKSKFVAQQTLTDLTAAQKALMRQYLG